MIAVVIDIPMPEYCAECPFLFVNGGYMQCKTDGRYLYEEDKQWITKHRPNWCPLEEVKTRQRGHWILDPDGMDWNLPAWVCSECHGRHNGLPIMNGVNEKNIYQWAGSRFCPNCGAMMGRQE